MNSKLYNQQNKKLVKSVKTMNTTEWNDIFSVLQDVVLKSYYRYKECLEYLNNYISMWEKQLTIINNFIDILNKYIPSKSIQSFKN